MVQPVPLLLGGVIVIVSSAPPHNPTHAVIGEMGRGRERMREIEERRRGERRKVEGGGGSKKEWGRARE